MLKYRFPTIDVEVFLDVDSPHQSALIQYQGDESWVEVLQTTISEGYGAFGHGIGDATTAIDLDACIHKALSKFTFEILEGADLVASYSPGIPPGCVT